MTAEIPPFRLGARRVVAGIAALLALALVVVLVTPAPERASTAAADSFSRSAVGHAAFVAFLRDQGVAVEVARGRTRVPRPDAAVLYLEPPTGDVFEFWGGGDGSLDLIVLPKRSVEAEPGADRVRSAELLPAADIEALVPFAALVRRTAPMTCDEGVELPSPQLFRFAEDELEDEYGVTVEPVLRCGDAILVARLTDGLQTWYLVSDPDLLNNWGIGRGRNAETVLALVKGLERPVVIDESIHGYGPPTSLLGELRQFPLNLVTIHLALLAAVILWAGARRFGPVRELPPRLPPGGETLAYHAAGLLTQSGSRLWTVQQTWARVLHRLGEQFHGLGDQRQRASDPHLLDRLDAIATARGLVERASAIDTAVRAAAARTGVLHRLRGSDARGLFALIRRISDFERSLIRDS